MKKVFILFTTIIFMFCISISAQKKNPSTSPENINSIPSKISYQGVLTDNNGVPQNGTYDMLFGLYQSQSGGNAVWEETQSNVPVNDGLFNVYLGVNSPLEEIPFGVPYWLQVTVSGTVLPRTGLTSSPYSFNTSSIQGRKISSTIPNNNEVLKWNGSQWIPSPDETSGGTASGDLDGNYPGPITVIGLRNKPLSTTIPSINGQVMKWDGSQWYPGTDEVGGFNLPYSGTYNGGDPAFEIENPTMGLKARFLTEADNILQLAPSGGTTYAPYGLLDIQNAFSGKTALAIENHIGSGCALQITSPPGGGYPFIIYNNGNYDGFEITNGNNGGRAIVVANSSDADAIVVNQDGTGSAGNFSITNSNNSNDALFASTNGSGFAGYFTGDIYATGTISSGGSSFEIDDPRDPANSVIRHSSVESPDMMNLYSGIIITDASGSSIVRMPDYFEALNRDFRYQLTVIGQFAQAIILQEIQNNQFIIKTDKPNVKVSWQVTGIRKDPWAENNRIIVEQQKSAADRGFYLNSEVYGQTKTRSISWKKHTYLHK